MSDVPVPLSLAGDGILSKVRWEHDQGCDVLVYIDDGGGEGFMPFYLSVCCV